MKPRELILGVLVGVLAAPLLAGCGGATPVPGAAPPPVAVPGPVTPSQLAGVTLRVGDQKGNSQQLLLNAAGQLDGLPYKIQWATFTSGPPMLEAVNAGAIDVGQVGNTPPIFSAASGGSIGIVGVSRTPNGDALLVPKNSRLKNPAELRGKTIAVAKGSSAHGTLLNALNATGLSPADVKIQYLQPGDAFAAFSQGNVDAWAVWEPYVTQALQDAGARELISTSDVLAGSGPAGGTPLSNGLAFLVANRSTLADAGRNAAISDYYTRVATANRWAAEHPDAWASLYSKATGVPLPVAAKAAPSIVVTPVVIDDRLVASEQKLADTFSAAGLVPSHVDIAGFVDRRYNAAVESRSKVGR
jgi:sulfonate transport system substrate-binding protein